LKATNIRARLLLGQIVEGRRHPTVRRKQRPTMRSRRRGPHQAERATWFRPHQTESWRPWDPEKLRETPLRRLSEGDEVECSVYVDKDETNLVHEEWDFGTFVNGKNDVHIAMHYDFSFSRQFAPVWNVFVFITAFLSKCSHKSYQC
jgi:hypothetical protein